MTDATLDSKNTEARIAALTKRMLSGEPFTYSELVALNNRHGGREDDDRLADKTIQKWRRAGRISYVRLGRATYWSLTDLGRLEIAAAASQ